MSPRKGAYVCLVCSRSSRKLVHPACLKLRLKTAPKDSGEGPPHFDCARHHSTPKQLEQCLMRQERSALDVRNWMYRGLTP